MPSTAAPPLPARPLVVRLRNWVGDVVLGVPALRLLAAHGHTLHLVGKPWAHALRAGEGWAVEPLGSDWRARAGQLRRLRAACRAADSGFERRPLNAVVLPFSFSSALDARLAGLRAIGYAHEGRSFLLARPVPRRIVGHELLTYLRLACEYLGVEASPPESIELKIDPARRAQMVELRARHDLAAPYVVLGPYAGGTAEKQPKVWPHFPALAQALRAAGRRVVVVVGPGNEAAAERDYPGCTVMAGIDLGVYAALLHEASLMIANDTGPGHLAAAVGTPTLSILGPTDASRWRPWGPHVTVVQQADRGWAPLEAVTARAESLLGDAELKLRHG